MIHKNTYQPSTVDEMMTNMIKKSIWKTLVSYMFDKGFPSLELIYTHEERWIMGLSKQEQMKILLEQLHMPEEYRESHFKDARFKRLDVYKKTETWHFHIRVKHVLPYTIYQLLRAKLH